MLKSFAREFIPPIIWRAVRVFKQKYRRFPSWKAAAAAAGTYENDVLTAFRVARAGGVVSLSDNALFWLTAILPSSISIIDFGGATGEIGSALGAAGLDISYTVVENSALVARMTGTARNFSETIPTICDVFFTSGTLQYIPEPYGALEQGFASAQKAVVLKRNNFSERDIFGVHISRLFENGSGPIPPGFIDASIVLPFRTVKESIVLEIASRHGFDLLARTSESDGVPVPWDGVYGAQLVFLKRQI